MTRLEALEAKRQQINAKIAACRAKEARSNRARDTRKKIIFGATALKLAEKDNALFERIIEAIPAKDKALFEGRQKTLEAIKELRAGGGREMSLDEAKALHHAQN